MKFLKTTLLGGLLVVLPVWLCVLVLLQIVGLLGGVIAPISNHLPASVAHPRLIAVGGLVALCFVVGLIIKTTIGLRTKALVERHVLDRLPGYTMMRGLAEKLASFNAERGFRSALAVIEDALVPAFIVEEHADGRYTVFVPAAPTPASGAIYILDRPRVHPLNVSLVTMMTCISQWGVGSGKLLEAMRGPAGAEAPGA